MIDLLIAPITSLLDKVIQDKDQKAKLAHEIATMATNQAHEIQKLQIGVNANEASHASLFVAGWRPFIGWCCGLGIANNYLIAPYLGVPSLDLGEMMPVLLGMLGLGGMRTYERTKGVHRNAIEKGK